MVRDKSYRLTPIDRDSDLILNLALYTDAPVIRR